MSSFAMNNSPPQHSVSTGESIGVASRAEGPGKPPSGPTIDKNLMPAPRRPFHALMASRLANQSIPKMKVNDLDFTAADANDSDSSSNEAMDKILATLNEQTARLKTGGPTAFQASGEHFPNQTLDVTSSSSLPITPAVVDFPATAPLTRSSSAVFSDPRDSQEEVVALRLKLAEAESRIDGFRHELAATRHPLNMENNPQLLAARSTSFSRDTSVAFSAQDEDLSDAGEALNVPGRYNNHIRGSRAASTMWGAKSAYPMPGSRTPVMETPGAAAWPHGRGPAQAYMYPSGPYSMAENHFSNSRMTERAIPEHGPMPRGFGGRRGGRVDTRFQPHAQGPYGNGYGNYSPVGPPENSLVPYPMASPANMGPGGGGGGFVGMAFGGYPGAPNTSLSPHATEFTSNAGWRNEVRAFSMPIRRGGGGGGAKLNVMQALATEGQTWLPPTEPINYRRLLDRSVNCNWKYIVDKIVCQHDQQASIFLQQKLKVSSPEQKFEIVEAIIGQAYPLMVNRFGNFLVQRCFEHGTPEQVIKIAEAIRTHTVSLSMDPFGCHVIQKAFDSVPEEYKAMMVNELLTHIPETVIHRYACHVWQKLFELRWQETPPQIMQYVNQALRGMWHEVALGETGSLVVQNIFENCLEEDKRPCIEEVLANIDIVAHGQFGNWCIQHVCEHGAPADRSRAIDHVIRYASEYSTDQYASKVVEKCLKIGGPEFLGRYLDRVCEGRPDRPRLPLIDIASDQYGNYLIQYILTNSNVQHRDIVMAHIRKHMVSLRGSKFGSRVGMLCTNPAVATRPGPAVGPGVGNPRGMGGHHGGNRYGGGGGSMYR